MNHTLERTTAHAGLRHRSRICVRHPHAHRTFIAHERMP
jgi:hypothetical protein